MNRRMLKMLAAGLAAAAASAGLPGCDTVRGVGDDLTEVTDNTTKAITGEPRTSDARGGSGSRNRE